MQKNKHLLFSLYLLVGVLIFISCQKEAPIVEASKIEVSKIEELFIEEPIVDPINFKNHAAMGVTVMEDIVSILFQAALQNPQLFYNFQGNTVETRTDCPSTTETSGTIGSYPVSLDLDFNCSPAHAGTLPVNIIGTLDVDFNAAILTGSASNVNDIVITPSSDFQIGDYKIALSGGGTSPNIKLRWDGTGYDIKMGNATEGTTVTVTDDCAACPTKGYTSTYTTQHGSDFFGTVVLDPAGTNDPNDPTTYFDDAFLLEIFDLDVACSNGTTTTNLCLDTPSSNPLKFQPQTCGCITEGRIRVQDAMMCDPANPITGGTSTTYTFDSSPGAGIEGECDDQIFVEGVGVMNMKSC